MPPSVADQELPPAQSLAPIGIISKELEGWIAQYGGLGASPAC